MHVPNFSQFEERQYLRPNLLKKYTLGWSSIMTNETRE